MATVLVLGSGGREHALIWSLSRSPKVGKILACPGNGGTSRTKKVVNVPESSDLVGSFGRLDLCVVGPEAPLVAGVADRFRAAGVPTFGPSKDAAVIEASKRWSKEFMVRRSLPTARFAAYGRDDETPAMEEFPYDVVVKADGLAAGKGVIVPPRGDPKKARQAFETLRADPSPANDVILVEERLEGPEISLIAWCDGSLCECMPPAQDHKRAFFGDRGKNTGGMGAYAPSPLISPKALEKAKDIMRRAVDGLKDEGRPFVGALYGGFMLVTHNNNEEGLGSSQEPYLLEFNARFGDPETQVLMPLLKSDSFDVMLACAEGRLHDVAPVRYKRASAAAVVVASKGYPEKYEKGRKMSFLFQDHQDEKDDQKDDDDQEGRLLFHAGTALGEDPGDLVTSGGRVLAAAALAPELKGAVAAAYALASRVRFQGAFYRSDVGRRCLDAPVRMAVLGSTRGTSFQPLLESVLRKELDASIEVVVSNKDFPGGILDKAREGKVRAVHLPYKTQNDAASYGAKLTELLREANVELVLLIGWMRILSPTFVDDWRGRCLNVHPSLLPDYAGGMDLAVHEAVLRDGKTESGCTVHLVTEDVDGGAVVCQSTCAVDVNTPEALKARVQAMEGPALIAAVRRFANGDAGERFVPRADLVGEQRRSSRLGGSSSSLGAKAKAKAAASPTKAPPPSEEGPLTYRSAGVDIVAGNALVERIKPLAAATKVAGAVDAIGGFGAVFDLSAAGFGGDDVLLVSGTDGVGTKLKLATEAARALGDDKYAVGVGVDLVAMCANDVATTGATPLYFLDYYATGKLDVDRCARVVEGVAKGCLDSGCALTGGETAEMPGLYTGSDYDVAGFCVGAVRRHDLLPKKMRAGDVLLALPSTGIHSNGFSLVRKILEKNVVKTTLADALRADASTFFEDPSGRCLADVLLAPTALYSKPLRRLRDANVDVLAAAHITGGGILENLPRILPEGLDAELAEAAIKPFPPLFRWLQANAAAAQGESHEGLPDDEMLRTFNCGIGLILVVHADDAQPALDALPDLGIKTIGSLVETTATTSKDHQRVLLR